MRRLKIDELLTKNTRNECKNTQKMLLDGCKRYNMKQSLANDLIVYIRVSH